MREGSGIGREEVEGGGGGGGEEDGVSSKKQKRRETPLSLSLFFSSTLTPAGHVDDHRAPLQLL